MNLNQSRLVKYHKKFIKFWMIQTHLSEWQLSSLNLLNLL